MKLLSNKNLLRSSVVANNLMNRGRGCTGRNSYERELSFNPIEFLKDRGQSGNAVSWLDVGCGEGLALIEAAEYLTEFKQTNNPAQGFRITGIDLVGMFAHDLPKSKGLQFLESSIEDYDSNENFDLITAVHSLHYIGNKLSVIQKAARQLKEDGFFIASLDTGNLKSARTGESNRAISAFLRKNGFTVKFKKHLIALQGRREFDIPFEYVGADDAAGPNYTGQSAVYSYYRI